MELNYLILLISETEQLQNLHEGQPGPGQQTEHSTVGRLVGRKTPACPVKSGVWRLPSNWP